MSKPILEDLFSFRGRRNRKSYFLGLLIWIAVMCAVWGVAAGVSAGSDSSVPLIVAVLLSLPAALCSWAVGSQRCRDFGWTGWAMLLTLIPYIGGLFVLAIMFIPGTAGPNCYGPDPLA